MNDQPEPNPPVNREGWWTREHALIVVLVVVTTLLLYLCWQLIQPFLTPIAWAIALAVVAHPLHSGIARRIDRPGLAAGLAVFVIALIIVAPLVFVGNSIVQEAVTAVKAIQAGLQDGTWREQLMRNPYVGGAYSAIETQGNVGDQVQGMTAEIGKRVSQAVAGSAWVLVELVLTLFILFFLFRDRREALATLRSLVPLSAAETNKVFTRVNETIQATVFGTLAVAAVQGTLGGLMFWWLGLPAPMLWGAVMGVFAIVPVLGTFVIWVPAAIFLAASGHWGKAMILAGWGALAIGTIDNLLYPMLVGKKLRLHTVPVFLSLVGGLSFFGASGLVLGPLILALTDAILEIWRRRTTHGRPAEAATSAAEQPAKGAG